MPTAGFEVLTACRFYVELSLDGSTGDDAIFLECRGMRSKQMAVEVAEVTPRFWGKEMTNRGMLVLTKVPGDVTCTNIILRRGMSRSIAMWNWFQQVERGNWATKRRSGSLTVYTQAGEPTTIFQFHGAWPTVFGATSGKFAMYEGSRTGFDASSGEFAIEEVELAVEELTRVL